MRLKLTTAVLAVQIDQMLRELTLPNCRAIFWTDSAAVLQMISNTNKRFPVFVANRLTRIEERTSADQWRYVPSKKNPADMATRGIDAESFVSNSNIWLQGPDILLEVEYLRPRPPCLLPNLSSEFLTLKKLCNVLSKTKTDFFMESKFSRFSTWYELRKSVAWLLCVKDKLLRREITSQAISVDELDCAENKIIKCVQEETFSEEISQLRSGKQRERNNCLLKLNPRVFEGILRVGGRLQQSKQSFDVQHPIVLPSFHHVTKLIVEDPHRAVGHSGPGII